MRNYTERNLNQKAVYWGNPRSDGYGNYLYDDPIEIDCRWEDVSMTEEDGEGVVFSVRHEVQVAQDLDEEGMLKLCELVDLDSDEINDPVKAQAKMIVRFDKIPNIKGTCFYRKAYLGRLWTGKT